MRVLLDENMPHQLRAFLRHHDTATTVYMGWDGWKNGVLLKAAESSGFDVLVTGDKALPHQQNLTGVRIALICLSAHNWRIIKPHVPRIVTAIDAAQVGTITRVECGVFPKKPE